MTDSDEKITYSLDVSEWAHPAGRGPVETHLARLSTPDPAIAAATLRALADRLDPPQPVRPTYREVTPARARAITAKLAAEDNTDTDPRPGRVTPDGCGPEHTYTGSCALTPVERINPNV